MSNSLKDALIKAGVVSKDSLEREKEHERREKIQLKGPSQEGIHAHHIRTDCANCQKNSPDVEYYEHTNRSIIAKWLCIPCADKAWISDETRQTNQSSQAKAGKFRREFGATKRFPAQNANQPNRPPLKQSQDQKPPVKQPAPAQVKTESSAEIDKTVPVKPAPPRPAQVLKPGQKFIPKKKNFGRK